MEDKGQKHSYKPNNFSGDRHISSNWDDEMQAVFSSF